MITNLIDEMRPDLLLDVGCGCASFTRSLCRSSARIVAIDAMKGMIPRWREESGTRSILFCCMDARALGFRSNAIPVVLERATLHHVRPWTSMIDEMLRVVSRFLVIEEPIDDLRSPVKLATFEAQGLMLRLQHEVGYPHDRHLEPERLLSYVRDRATVLEDRIERSEDPIPFDAFFDGFAAFAARTSREAYWLQELEAFRKRLGGATLCASDTLLILAAKDASG